jgi:transcriptional regulator with XRE-family HTH domain
MIYCIIKAETQEGGISMDNAIFKQVGNNIQDILSVQGITQQFLADSLGVSKQVMSKIVAGSKAINVAEIRKIASVLNVTADSLLAIKSEQEPIHNFAFMGQIENEETKKKIEFLKTVIDEMLMLEEYADA